MRINSIIDVTIKTSFAARNYKICYEVSDKSKSMAIKKMRHKIQMYIYKRANEQKYIKATNFKVTIYRGGEIYNKWNYTPTIR